MLKGKIKTDKSTSRVVNDITKSTRKHKAVGGFKRTKGCDIFPVFFHVTLAWSLNEKLLFTVISMPILIKLMKTMKMKNSHVKFCLPLMSSLMGSRPKLFVNFPSDKLKLI